MIMPVPTVPDPRMIKDLVARYGLITQAPSVDDLIKLMARVEALEKQAKVNPPDTEAEIDNPPEVADWEKLRQWASDLEQWVSDLRSTIDDHAARLHALENPDGATGGDPAPLPIPPPPKPR